MSCGGPCSGVVTGISGVAGGGNGGGDSLLTNLIAWWSLDEASGNRVDSHTGGYTLTDNNTVGSAAGKVSNAADFESTNSEYLSRANEAGIQTGDEDFAIAGWFSLESSGNQCAVSKDTSGNRGWALTNVASGGDKFRFQVSDGAAPTTVTETTVGGISLGTLYFVYAYHDAANSEIGISVNNNTIDTQALGITLRTSTAPLELGRQGSFSAYWDGLMDEVGYWRRLLTPAEVTRLYNSGSGMGYPG